MNIIQEIPLKAGARYTIYSLSGMATTMRREVTVTLVKDEPEFAKAYVSQTPCLSGTWRFGIHKLKSKRKTCYTSIKPTQDLIIPSWGHLQTDAVAYHCFQGNACLNFAGSVDEVKALIELNINPNFSAFDTVLAFPVPHTELPDHDGLMVYPESETTHAVVIRTRENLATRERGLKVINQ